MYPNFQQFIVHLALCLTGIGFQFTIEAQTKEQQNPLQLFGIFNNTATFETRIVPIFVSGKIQNLPSDNTGFQIPDQNISTSGDEWYGSATLAGDPKSGALYYADKSGNKPALWSLSANGKHAKMNQPGKILPGHFLTKMAMGPDGYVYAISTGRIGGEDCHKNEAIIIRFKPCNTTGCTTIEILGSLSGEEGYMNVLTYSGDMAFSANGDLFLFGTEIDTTINYYKGAHIYKIAAGKIRSAAKPGRIPIEYIGQIEGMGTKLGIDSTIITGVAFEPGGSFILSSVDKYSGSRVHFYRGSISVAVSVVKPIELQYNIPQGFVVSDLASFTIPMIQLPTKKSIAAKLQGKQKSEDNWEKYVTITRFNY